MTYPGFQSTTMKHAILLSILTIVLVFGGCSSSENVVATIGPYKLTLSEYERQYIRNNGGFAAAQRSTLQERKDFLNLLVKYRLKVLEAKERGYDKDPEILKELNEYRNSLAIPYLTERALIDPKIETLYNRRKEEVRAAHILIRTMPDSTGLVDTAAALSKAMKLTALAKTGASFDSLARAESEDPGSAQNGGDLMYFTAGMTAPVFDDAVYSLKKGEITDKPVQTMFGFHVIKVIDRRPTRGEIRCAHILTRIPAENPQDTAASYAKILAIKDSINKGHDFAALAMRNSEDPQSGAKGGDLDWVTRRRFVPEFDLVAFELKVGEVSDIVRTPFGYHIIKLLDERQQKPFEESRQELKDLYRRYGYEEDNTDFVQSILRKQGVNVIQSTIDQIIPHVDTVSTTAVAGWYNNVPETVRSLPFVTVAKKSISVLDAITTIERNKDLQGKPLNHRSLYEVALAIGQKEALELETADLEIRYPEFAELMQEYKEGVLLFRTEQDAVWNRVAIKEEALRAYWEEHKSEYRWPDRVRFREIFVANDSIANVLRDSLNTGVDFGELAARHTQRVGYKEKQGDWGLQTESANELSKKAMTMEAGWVEGPMKFQYGYSVIKVDEKQKAREKTFEEAQSEVSSKFQEIESKRLEREWIESLMKKYGVEVKEVLLTSAFGTGSTHEASHRH